VRAVVWVWVAAAAWRVATRYLHGVRLPRGRLRHVQASREHLRFSPHTRRKRRGYHRQHWRELSGILERLELPGLFERLKLSGIFKRLELPGHLRRWRWRRRGHRRGRSFDGGDWLLGCTPPGAGRIIVILANSPDGVWHTGSGGTASLSTLAPAGGHVV